MLTSPNPFFPCLTQWETILVKRLPTPCDMWPIAQRCGLMSPAFWRLFCEQSARYNQIPAKSNVLFASRTGQKFALISGQNRIGSLWCQTDTRNYAVNCSLYIDWMWSSKICSHHDAPFPQSELKVFLNHLQHQLLCRSLRSRQHCSYT